MSREDMLNELAHYGDIDYLITLSSEEIAKVYADVFGA